MAKSLIASLLSMLLVLFAIHAGAQCNSPDVEAPTVVCLNSIELTLLPPDETVTLTGTDMDAGSSDECPGALSFFLEESPASSTPPSTTSLTFDQSGIGQHEIVLWVVDQAGNADYCIASVIVRESCGNGNSAVLACNDEVPVVALPNETVNVFPGAILEGGPYCSDYTIKLGNGSFLPYLSIEESDAGYHQVTVRDEATGNSCWGYLNVQTGCTNDTESPTANCDPEVDVWLMAPSNTVELYATQFDGGSSDNCPGNLSYFAEIAPASPTPPTDMSLVFNEGSYIVELWVVDQAGNASHCSSELTVHPDCSGGNSPALVCKDQVVVAVPPDYSLYPNFFLEGGPYCSDYLVRLDNGSFFNVVFANTNNIGTHTFEVKDQQTGNSCWGTLEIITVCGPDTEAPVATCLSTLSLEYETGGVTLDAVDLNGGSLDNCPGPLQFFIEKAPASPAPPSSTSVTYDENELGTNTAVLWVVDAAGNASYCTSSIVVDSCDAPTTLACNDGLVVVVQGSQPTNLYPADILEGDFCPNQMQIALLPNGAPQDYLSIGSNNAGVQIVQVVNVTTGNSCWGTIHVMVDCTNDNVPPTPVCNQTTTAQASVDGPDLTYLTATIFNQGSYDNCTPFNNLSFAIEQGPMPSTNMPTATSLAFTAVGTYDDVYVWVADANGNANYCNVTVVIVPPKCNPDQTPPALVAPADTTISSDDLAAMNLNLQDYAQLDSYFGTAYTWDYCGFDTLIQSNGSILDNCGNLVTLTRTFQAIDEAGNTWTSQQQIHISRDFSINLPSDFHPGDPGAPGEVTVLSSGGLQFGISYTDINTDFNCDELPDYIVRKWDIVNLCDFDQPENPFVLPFHDGDNNGQIGDPYAVWVVNDSIYLLENGLPVENFGENTGMFKYKQFIQFNNDDTLQLSVVGTVFVDTLVNCSLDSNEPLLANWKVKATGLTSGHQFFATTDSNGHYELNQICAIDEEVEISLDVPFNYGQTCATTYVVQTISNMPAVQNIVVQLDEECDLMEVDLATPFLRRCFPNTYTVSYTNYSAQLIEDSHVEVQLDDFMTYTASSIPGNMISNNLYAFNIGDLLPGQSGSFTIDFDLSCNAELGQTHCTEAHIFPDTLCPVNANWSGANVEVKGECVNDEVRLSIKNTGSGNMNGPLNFIVVEDVIMFDGGSFNLAAGETFNLTPIAATGATYRLEAQQVVGHPYPGNVAVAMEGCNGLNMTGLVNLFPLENPNPFIASDCRENEGSFDPNDKSALPLGYGEEHYIYRNTDIDYLIRFQNTGTDTAFTVVVMDTLSPYLDPVSIRPGASSHPFNFELLDGNVLRFTFSNILLPDSSENFAASQGFIQFKAKQMPALPNGTVIENEAAIYFDFNDPIITNRVYHTIGEGFIEVSSTVETGDNRPQPKVYPNPSSSYVVFELPIDLGEKASFDLYNSLGQLQRSDYFDGMQYRFERKGLAPGVYTYTISANGVKQYLGKVILE